ncbi:histidinol dehydrogenase [Marinilabiliaceae bacterium ANBcel2]|nr:histidinol dehydrogenase [Marinilabiliaceae bacterium ANBcel2]
MEIFSYPEQKELAKILIRPEVDYGNLFDSASEILNEIKKEGDSAINKYTEKFDHYSGKSIAVSKKEIKEAESQISIELKNAINRAAANIKKFHAEQLYPVKKVNIETGIICWQKSVPIEKVGLYIPGGTAPLFSTTLMLAIPAQIAGCKEIILCSPPNSNGKINPAILYAADIAGVKKIYKIGGIQAVAAMAYGTETVPKVYKIFGPGNKYVTAAKQLVSLDNTAIDLPAGPSEVLVIADNSANPAFVAADLLSQAEHGVGSQVILLTNSKEVLNESMAELEKQVSALPREKETREALKESKALLMKSMDDIIAASNYYAPEHLILLSNEAEEIADKVINAGSVFIGHYTPESAGDYASGTNHTLPTYGYAKTYSGVNIDSYIKKITFQKITKEGLQSLGPAIKIMAESEMLEAHKNAVSVRLKS